MYNRSADTLKEYYIVERYNECAVTVHDRQDSRVGRRTAQGSGNDWSAGMRTKHTKSMSVALCRSGQHCNERSIVIELNGSHLFVAISRAVVLASRRLF
jgi:hypothetical protein